jgi:hypothetical protein
MLRLVTLGTLLALSHLTLLCGCAEKDDSGTVSQTDEEVTAESSSIKDVLALWKTGQKEDAVKRFVSINWNDPSVCEQVRVLEMTEKEFLALARHEQEQVVQEAIDCTNELTALMKHIASVGVELASTGDKATANAYFEAVRSYGETLGGREHLEVVRAHGMAAVQYATKGLSSIK